MKIMDYVLVAFGAIVTVLGAVGIYLNAKTNIPLLFRGSANTVNIIGLVMIFSGIVLMIVGAIIIEHRKK